MSTKLGNELRRAAGKEGDVRVARRLNEYARLVDKTVFALGPEGAVNTRAVRDARKALDDYKAAHARS